MAPLKRGKIATGSNTALEECKDDCILYEDLEPTNLHFILVSDMTIYSSIMQFLVNQS